MALQRDQGTGAGGPPLVVFIHIPKTAGSTLRRILERQYPSDAIYGVDGFHLQDSWARLGSLAEAVRSRLGVVLGHMPFGIHEALQPRRCSYITLLRHPVDRLLSHYSYVARTPQSPQHHEVIEDGMSLRDYVERARMASLVNDGQTRLLGAAAFTEAPPATEKTLRSAKANLERWFEVAAPTERFDEAVMMMRRRLGWEWPTYTSQKVSPARSGPVDKATVDAILARNRLDLELYQFVTERFVAQLRSEGAGFGDDVARFAERNARFTERDVR
jgi:hypothetical protein